MTTLVDTDTSLRFSDAEGLALDPYARWMRFELLDRGDGLRGQLRPSDHLLGNPQLQLLHGGVLATLLQLTGAAIVMDAMDLKERPRLLSSTVQYLGAARAVDTFCRGRVISRSRRFTTVQAAIFQGSPEESIAAATLQFLLVE